MWSPARHPSETASGDLAHERWTVWLALLLLGLPASPSSAHDWYQGLKSPREIECCGDYDCHPVEYRIDERTGRQEVRLAGAWRTVENRMVVRLSTPDGGAHACWSSPGGSVELRCVILPAMAQAPHPTPSAMTVLLATPPPR